MENGVEIVLTPEEETARDVEEKAWLAKNPIISLTDVEVQAEITRLQKEYENNKYQRDRKAEYPSIEDVTVALAEKAEGDSTMWDEITVKRQAIKEKYPKGDS
jgi:hypothetical protein